MARRATNVTRTRIQDVALALFATRGYDATSLQEIATALGVTKAALYYHFPSKAELLHSLADPFLDGERTIQHTQVPVPVSPPFDQFSGTFADPFHNGTALTRMDYQFANGAKAFYRFSYFKNSLGATFGYGYSLYNNVNITRNHMVGVDFNTGAFTHSVRFSFLKFQNQLLKKEKLNWTCQH